MPAEYFLAHIWMIPLFPLAGAALMLFLAGLALGNAPTWLLLVALVGGGAMLWFVNR